MRFSSSTPVNMCEACGGIVCQGPMDPQEDVDNVGFMFFVGGVEVGVGILMGRGSQTPSPFRFGC